MTIPKRIKNILVAMTDEAGIKLARAEQNSKRPSEIFLSYKIISTEGEPSWQRIETRHEIEDNSELVKITEKEEIQVMVSCTLIGDARFYSEVWAKSYECMAWLESEEAENLFSENKLLPIDTGSSVQDRSSHLETGYETRLGFDIIFNVLSIKERNEGTIDAEKIIQSMNKEA